MDPRTTCPHPVHLRWFSHGRAPAREADAMREHLVHCEACRAVVAGFAPEDMGQNTCIFEDVIPPRQAERSPAEDEFQQTCIIEGAAPPRQPDRARGEDEIQNTCVIEALRRRARRTGPGTVTSSSRPASSRVSPRDPEGSALQEMAKPVGWRLTRRGSPPSRYRCGRPAGCRERARLRAFQPADTIETQTEDRLRRGSDRRLRFERAADPG